MLPAECARIPIVAQQHLGAVPLIDRQRRTSTLLRNPSHPGPAVEDLRSTGLRVARVMRTMPSEDPGLREAADADR